MQLRSIPTTTMPFKNEMSTMCVYLPHNSQESPRRYRNSVHKKKLVAKVSATSHSRLTKPTNRDEPLIFALTVFVLHLHMNATDFLTARPFIVFGN
ncbi:hypothetical protein CEXT_15561 [Caerostris extrusa]|uniref:Uncharacterized protein n=1 Tax=Caerostris extrusa TaxID=172846 RepID=A0AAV4MGB5_CAEEX|nr:hypothetical protein CEXT_15561 [Caerostris extrusa]